MKDVSARVFSLMLMFFSHLFYHCRYCCLHSALPPPLLLPPHHTFRSLCVVVLRLCPCKLLSGLFYGADNSSYNRTYYQESIYAQAPHKISGVQYSENYQYQFDPRYGRGYGVPTPHQQSQQPNFMCSTTDCSGSFGFEVWKLFLPVE
ncbi:hypothetical protein AHAS_Ahas12G0176100 [Arachis hypogaea]